MRPRLCRLNFPACDLPLRVDLDYVKRETNDIDRRIRSDCLVYRRVIDIQFTALTYVDNGPPGNGLDTGDANRLPERRDFGNNNCVGTGIEDRKTTGHRVRRRTRR